MIAIPDHLLVILLFIVAPLTGAREYRTLAGKVRAGDRTALARAFRGTILQEWAAVLILLAWWGLSGRTLASLGLEVPPGARTVAGVALTLAGLGFVLWQWRTVSRGTEEVLRQLRSQMASVAEMMPRTDLEYRWFRAVSVTAGICEEILFRGFVTWYLGHWMPLWLAAVIGAVGFGLAHAYQGMTGIIKTGVTGLLMGLLFVASGSLLWPIILHVAVDLQGGAMARKVLVSDEVAAGSGSMQ